ncbi:unnamed protein product [Polarella glacialis]|uniref:RING-type domain-containing protein n=1 Tax=Polarella glacialis TaxID=89957 RepID=A0A813EKY0_POLGL|nr:unnamed protein product [Polarella glacialis]
MIQRFLCLKTREWVAHVRHKFRLYMLLAVFSLSVGELFYVTRFYMPLAKLWPGREMLFMVGAAASILAALFRLGQVGLQLSTKVNDRNTWASSTQLWGQFLTAAMASTQVLLSLFLAAIITPWCALLLLTSAALDFLLLLLQRPKGLLGPPQASASRHANMEEYERDNWQQRDGFHYGQAVEFKNFTWPSNETPALGKQTPDFEVSTCMVCLADFVAGDLLSSLPCGHSFHAACITGWQQHSRHSNNSNNNNSHNHSVCPLRCTTSQPVLTVSI